jgi:hypothetical protein
VSYEAQNEMKHVEITPAMDEIDRQVLHGTLPDYELFEGEAEKSSSMERLADLEHLLGCV